MAKTVYLETSVISYVAAKPSRDLLVAGHQQASIAWWDQERTHYDVVISQLVIDESSAGNADAASKRLSFLRDLELIEITADVLALAHKLVKKKAIPAKANADALHVAVCAVHEVDYLLTWNCKHINNPHMRRQIDNVCFDEGFIPPVICTPEELSEE